MLYVLVDRAFSELKDIPLQMWEMRFSPCILSNPHLILKWLKRYIMKCIINDIRFSVPMRVYQERNRIFVLHRKGKQRLRDCAGFSAYSISLHFDKTA